MKSPFLLFVGLMSVLMCGSFVEGIISLVTRMSHCRREHEKNCQYAPTHCPNSSQCVALLKMVGVAHSSLCSCLLPLAVPLIFLLSSWVLFPCSLPLSHLALTESLPIPSLLSSSFFPFVLLCWSLLFAAEFMTALIARSLPSPLRTWRSTYTCVNTCDALTKPTGQYPVPASRRGE